MVMNVGMMCRSNGIRNDSKSAFFAGGCDHLMDVAMVVFVDLAHLIFGHENSFNMTQLSVCHWVAFFVVCQSQASTLSQCCTLKASSVLSLELCSRDRPHFISATLASSAAFLTMHFNSLRSVHS